MATLNPPFRLNLFSRNKTETKVSKATEDVFIYDFDNEIAYRAKMPRVELLATVDQAARYVPSGDKAAILAPLLGGSCFSLFGFMVGYFYGGSALGVMGAFPAAFIGTLVGWVAILPLIQQKPLWVVGKIGGAVKGIAHSRTDPTMAKDRHIMTPDMIYEISECRDLLSKFRAGLSKFQKIALGALITLVIACMVALFLFVGAFGTGG